MKKRKNLIFGILTSCLFFGMISGNALADTNLGADGDSYSYGPNQTGIICDLSDPYFYENYYNQVYDLSYCEWDKIMSNK